MPKSKRVTAIESSLTQHRFIPCTTPVNAVFKDGEAYPVICWNVKDGELVGMIVEGNSPYLVDVTYFGADFARYEYPTEV